MEGSSPGLAPEIAAAKGTLEESRVSGNNLVVLSPPTVVKSHTCSRRDLDMRNVAGGDKKEVK